MKKQYKKPEVEVLLMQQQCMLIVQSLTDSEDVKWVDDGIGDDDDDV